MDNDTKQRRTEAYINGLAGGFLYVDEPTSELLFRLESLEKDDEFVMLNLTEGKAYVRSKDIVVLVESF